VLEKDWRCCLAPLGGLLDGCCCSLRGLQQHLVDFARGPGQLLHNLQLVQQDGLRLLRTLDEAAGKSSREAGVECLGFLQAGELQVVGG
jgi:hypothetical protein